MEKALTYQYFDKSFAVSEAGVVTETSMSEITQIMYYDSINTESVPEKEINSKITSTGLLT
jgi:hypothetical protein